MLQPVESSQILLYPSNRPYYLKERVIDSILKKSHKSPKSPEARSHINVFSSKVQKRLEF